MANTVNDVMNVISNPDYGIKNIAGTTQEILAILQGTNNSQNNIHVIVDDVKHLLQQLVVVSTEKKLIEIGNNSSNINNKHIENILDETKGIRTSINNLAEIMKKQGGNNMPAVAKLSNKASEKVAEAMIKNIDIQNKNGGLSSLVDAFNKLKNISLKDIIIGKQKVKLISKVFKNAQKDLKIKDKDLDAVIKLINTAPEMMKALKKVGWRVNLIIMNKTIKKLSNILIGDESLLSLSKTLQKNKKVFDNAIKLSKGIKELASSLNKAMMELVLSSMWSKFANNAITSLEKVIDNLIPLSKKLIKNTKDIDKGAKAAKNITVLVGNLLTTSIFLTIAVVTAVPAILGATLLSVMVDIIIPIAKKLSKNNKKMTKAVGSAFILLTFTGLMAITTFILNEIASTGLDALLGAGIMLGVVLINVLAFKLLKNNLKPILIGAISMAIMSGSLILFGIALQKITDATKDVSWKQVGIIATMTVLLGGVVAILGIPAVVPFILLGALSMGIMGACLIPFGIALQKISDSTKDVSWKQVGTIALSIVLLGGATAVAGLLSILIIPGSIAIAAMGIGLILLSVGLKVLSENTKDLSLIGVGISALSIILLGAATAAVGLFSIFIIPGAIALGIMSISLMMFSKTLKEISKTGDEISFANITAFCGAMAEVGLALTLGGASLPGVALGAKTVKTMTNALNPFINILKTINGFKEPPTNIINKLLKGLSTTKDFFTENWLEIKVVENAERYQDLMKPFFNSAMQLSMLKAFGDIPINTIFSALASMLVISNHYTKYPIDDDTIDQAEEYLDMLKPFGNAMNHLAKLKKMGDVPLDLVSNTLSAMNTIANHYTLYPIDDDTIDQAEEYLDMLKPFGKTMGYLAKLKEMGGVPLDLVNGTLNAMNTIANHYIKHPIDDDTIDQAENYEDMLKPFGTTMEYLAKLKEMGDVPLDLVNGTLNAMNTIAIYYAISPINDDIIDKAEQQEEMMEIFSNTLKYFPKIKEIGEIPINNVLSVIRACIYITTYYRKTKFWVPLKKVFDMNTAVISFLSTINSLKNTTNDFTNANYQNTQLIIQSMYDIITFLNLYSMGKYQRFRAYSTLNVLDRMSYTMLFISKLDASNISSVGNALTNTLNGVNAVDIDRVNAVTNMFNAFSKINKTESIIDKFTESVEKFTTACENLMTAMGNNTDAINNMDSFGFGINSPFINNNENHFEMGLNDNNPTQQKPNGIRIINVDEIARTIAEKINGAISVDVPDTQVQLLINGSGGNEWTITRY